MQSVDELITILVKLAFSRAPNGYGWSKRWKRHYPQSHLLRRRHRPDPTSTLWHWLEQGILIFTMFLKKVFDLRAILQFPEDDPRPYAQALYNILDCCVLEQI